MYVQYNGLEYIMFLNIIKTEKVPYDVWMLGIYNVSEYPTALLVYIIKLFCSEYIMNLDIQLFQMLKIMSGIEK